MELDSEAESLFYSNNYAHSTLLISFLLIISLWKSTLLISRLIKSLLFWRRCYWIHGTRIDVDTSWLTNTLSINLLWLDNKDGVRKRFLALPTGKFVRKDFNLDTQHTLTKKDVTGSRIDEIADLFRLDDLPTRKRYGLCTG